MNRTQSKNQEVRNRAASVELRKSKSGAILEGRIPYNSRSSFLGFFETLRCGCFADSLRNGPEPFAYWSHDTAQPLGRTSNGTLRITDTDSALLYAVTLPETNLGRDLAALAEDRTIDSTSFGFSVDAPEDEQWSLLPDGTAHRLIKRATIYEVSPVSVGAYPAASVKLAARSALRYAPVAIRERLKRDDDSTDDDGDVVDDSDSDCLCECEACAAANCADCTASDCNEETCSCDVSERSLHVALLLRRAQLLA